MKRLFPIFAVLCVLAGAFTSCTPTVEFDEIELIGKWKAPSESAPASAFQYCIFLEDKDDTGEYRLGKFWDEGEGTYESDLGYDITDLKNGWFKWKLTDNELMEIHLMEYGWAEVPQRYTITTLSAATLTYEDSFGNSITWTR